MRANGVALFVALAALGSLTCAAQGQAAGHGRGLLQELPLGSPSPLPAPLESPSPEPEPLVEDPPLPPVLLPSPSPSPLPLVYKLENVSIPTLTLTFEVTGACSSIVQEALVSALRKEVLSRVYQSTQDNIEVVAGDCTETGGRRKLLAAKAARQPGRRRARQLRQITATYELTVATVNTTNAAELADLAATFSGLAYSVNHQTLAQAVPGIADAVANVSSSAAITATTAKFANTETEVEVLVPPNPSSLAPAVTPIALRLPQPVLGIIFITTGTCNSLVYDVLVDNVRLEMYQRIPPAGHANIAVTAGRCTEGPSPAGDALSAQYGVSVFPVNSNDITQLDEFAATFKAMAGRINTQSTAAMPNLVEAVEATGTNTTILAVAANVIDEGGPLSEPVSPSPETTSPNITSLNTTDITSSGNTTDSGNTTSAVNETDYVSIIKPTVALNVTVSGSSCSSAASDVLASSIRGELMAQLAPHYADNIDILAGNCTEDAASVGGRRLLASSSHTTSRALLQAGNNTNSTAASGDAYDAAYDDDAYDDAAYDEPSNSTVEPVGVFDAANSTTAKPGVAAGDAANVTNSTTGELPVLPEGLPKATNATNATANATIVPDAADAANVNNVTAMDPLATKVTNTSSNGTASNVTYSFTIVTVNTTNATELQELTGSFTQFVLGMNSNQSLTVAAQNATAALAASNGSSMIVAAVASLGNETVLVNETMPLDANLSAANKDSPIPDGNDGVINTPVSIDYDASVFGETRSTNCSRGCNLCTSDGARTCVKCSAPNYVNADGVCVCSPGRGGPWCQLCAVGLYSVGGNATDPFPACGKCPEGFETRRTGATSSEACAVCAVSAGYTCSTCLPLPLTAATPPFGVASPSVSPAPAESPSPSPSGSLVTASPSPAPVKNATADNATSSPSPTPAEASPSPSPSPGPVGGGRRRLSQYRINDGVPACYQYGSFDAVVNEDCSSLAVRSNISAKDLQALNPMLDCNGTNLQGSMCVSATCPPGYGGPANPNCSLCPQGSYASGTYDPRFYMGAPCTPCPAGYTTLSSGASDPSECIDCAEGYYCTSCTSQLQP